MNESETWVLCLLMLSLAWYYYERSRKVKPVAKVVQMKKRRPSKKKRKVAG